MPVEDSKPVIPFTADEEVRLLKSCDDWQFPIFLTLLMTGMRPGELAHLLLPDDLDLEHGWLRVRNKQLLGWQVKTRNERDIPLHPILSIVLHVSIAGRKHGPVFQQRRCSTNHNPPLAGLSVKSLEKELARRMLAEEKESTDSVSRVRRSQVAYTIWRDLGALNEDQIRVQFMRTTKAMGLPETTAPKTLRHTFATMLQESNVDPLVRNELMGHSPFSATMSGKGLGMTAVYTHTRPETKKRALELAFENRPILTYVSARQAASIRNTE